MFGFSGTVPPICGRLCVIKAQQWPGRGKNQGTCVVDTVSGVLYCLTVPPSCLVSSPHVHQILTFTVSLCPDYTIGWKCITEATCTGQSVDVDFDADVLQNAPGLSATRGFLGNKTLIKR